MELPKTLSEFITKGQTDPKLFTNELLGIPVHAGQERYMLISLIGVPSIVRRINNGELPELKDKIYKALGRKLQTPLEGWEVELIRRFLLSCANRWGKTVLISCLQIWYNFYKIGIEANTDEDWLAIEYRTANIAPESALTLPVFNAMKAILTSSFAIRDHETGKVTTNVCLIEWFYLREKTINTPPYKMYFLYNSYIEHLSLMGGKGNSLQGKPYGLITYDEACRSDHLQVELDNSVLGRLLDWTAPLHMLSTPDSDSASLVYYYRLYQEGLALLNHSYTQTGSISENTFMTDKQVEEQVKMLAHNPLKRQMLDGEFVWGSNTLFSGPDIVAAQDEGLDDGIRYEDGHKYVIGVDTAIGSDEMVYTVIDRTEKPYRLVRQVACKGNSKSPQLHLNDFLMLVDEYNRDNNVRICLETFNGESVRFFYDLPDAVKAITQCFGVWQPSTLQGSNKNPIKPMGSAAKKADILVNLRKLFAEKTIKIPSLDHRTIQQLTVYKEDDRNLDTDRVIALALACWYSEELANSVVQEWVDWAEW